MRIVGIGASAGGLSALEAFFRNMRADSGMAFIVVQHLDPTHKALLPEILQHATAMPVQEAQNGRRIEADTLYVIPPNTELSVSGDRLWLATPSEPRGLRLPINVLFSSLASACSAQAIGVVLSGMGSDGTLGLQAINATGGLTVAQALESAEFDAMPRSAIATGCVDIIAPVHELPERILTYVARLQEPSSPDAPKVLSMGAITPIVRILQQHTRHDFSLYKPSTLGRRIERRMAIHGIADLTVYADYLKENSQEVQLLFREVLIGVTAFFRDPETWAYLAEETLPELIENRASGDDLRAWVVGCSTGEEAYSLAILLSETLEHHRPQGDISFQIFASDLNLEAITVARQGQYPLTIENDVSQERLARFFTRHDNHYRISQGLRDRVLFAQHDVILDPPFTRLDLIACRNLLIYFDPVLQRRLLPMLHYSLRDNGLLMLGNSETVGRLEHLFAPLKPRLRLYRRKEHKSIDSAGFLLKSFPPLSTLAREPAVPDEPVPSRTTDTLQAAADRLLLQVYAPAAVVLNQDADIVYISGHTGKYLEPAAGKTTWNIHAMAREGLRAPLLSALRQASAQKEPVELSGLAIQTDNAIHSVDVTVQAFQEPAVLAGMTMVVFRDLPTAAPAEQAQRPPSASAAHAAEIQHYEREIERLSEEARLSREELQASNEELQSTNEELQSTNEELTSSKEEMQSMNEELQTINTELQSKLDDLALAQSDMQNVLNSIEIAILFLDQNLNVRRYTARTAKLISLRESDIGRPLSDLTTILEYPELESDARQTLDTLSVSEKQVTTSEGRWFSFRIMPYRRIDNVIDGVVMTMVDITETKELEQRLRDES